MSLVRYEGLHEKLQDIGVVALVRRVAPSLPIHASTQMSITSPDGADFARQLGARRVVVGRELSFADISAVSSGTDAEVEAFVHGALCVSYRCGSTVRVPLLYRYTWSCTVDAAIAHVLCQGLAGARRQGSFCQQLPKYGKFLQMQQCACQSTVIEPHSLH